MVVNQAPQVPTIVVGETNNFVVSFANVVDVGEQLVGTPLVVEETTSDLAIDHIRINGQELRINGRQVIAGHAIQFRVSGQQTSHSPYTLRISASTDAPYPQTKLRSIQFGVELV